MYKNKSIRIKLLAILSLVGVLPMVLLGIWSDQNLHVLLRDQISQQLVVVAEAKEALTMAFIEGLESRILDFSSDGLIREYLREISKTGSPKTVELLNRHLIRNKKPLDPDIVGIMVVGLNGKVIAATDAEEIGRDESDDEYFKMGLKGVFSSEFEKTGRSHYKLGEYFAVSAPVTDITTHEPLGVIINIIPTEKLRNILLRNYQLSRGGLVPVAGELNFNIYVVGSDKKVFVYPSVVAKNGVQGVFTDIVNTQPVKSCLTDGKEEVSVYRDYAGKEVLGASMCMVERGWVLLVEVETKEAFSVLTATRIYRLSIMLLFLGLSLFLAILYSALIARPIRKLAEGTEKIAGGDLDYRVNINTKDEIGLLAESFNDMADKLKEGRAHLEERVQEAVHEVEERTKKIEKLNKFMVGRELKMIELKKEIEILKKNKAHG